MIYNIIFISLLVLSLTELYMYNNNFVIKPQINIGILISIFLVFFAGGRVNTGLDYVGYEDYFIKVQNGSLGLINPIVEPMYVILSMISPSYRVLLFIMAIGCVVVKYIALRKLGVKLIAFAMFFYFSSFFLYYDMGIMRQGLAMGICLLSIPCAEKKDKKFFIYIIIASLVHISALLFMVIYFFSDKEFSRTIYYAMMGLAIIFAVMAGSSVVQNGLIERLIEAVAGGYINHKYNRYFSYETANYLNTVLKRVLIGIVFVEWFKSKSNRYDDKKELVWTYINGYILSIVIFSGMSLIGFASMAGRIVAGLYMLYFLLYERILRSNRHKLLKLGLLILFVALSFNTLNDIVTSSSGDLYRDYTFFLN